MIINDAFENSAYHHLVNISVELSSEKNTDVLMEKILLAVMDISGADAGSIYRVTKDKSLEFRTVINKTLGLHLGGSSAEPVTFADIPMHIDGKPNSSAIVSEAANSGKVINISDVYSHLPYDFSAARKIDQETGYRTKSMLTLPLRDHTDDIVGIIQLINAQHEGEIVEFSEHIQSLCLSFASLGAIALTNNSLIDNLEGLFSALIKTLARIIDEKSDHTGEHCKRVPELTLMFAEKVNEAKRGPFDDFEIPPEEMYQLEIAGWLHDCGKVATPDHIMDKSTKLHTFFDRIEYVESKFEIARNELEIKYQKEIIEALKSGSAVNIQQIEREHSVAKKQLNLDLALLQKVNVGGEFLTDENDQKILEIASRYTISLNGREQPLLTDDEVLNLRIKRGTLNDEERAIIQRHMDVTLDILEALPFPKHMSKVAEFALGHHETMDGKGYPRGLTKEQLSVPARIMAVADIFEALSSSDRPYKKAKPVSECLMIMGNMVKRNCLDEDLFTIFVESKVYEQYILKFSKPEQIDEFDVQSIPGLKQY